MPPYYHPSDSLVRRMLPAHNTDWRDRSQAWQDFIDQGGLDRVRDFIRQKNYIGLDEDDLLQETLITAYLKIEAGQYEDRELAFSGFLKKIASFKILEALRGRSGANSKPNTMQLDDLAELLGEVPAEHEQADHYLENRAMECTMRQMSPRRRHILALYGSGYDTAEIAERLGIREDLVRKEKSLALRALREAVLPFAPMMGAGMHSELRQAS